jgi:hypothetical protein
MALVDYDVAVSIEIGTQAAGGGAVSWSAPVAIEGIADELEIDDQSEMIMTKALAGRRKKYRPGSGETDIRINQLVNITGWMYFNDGTLIGRPARLTIKELSTLATPRQWTGLIQSWKWRIGSDTAQAENISIKCDIDATST